MSNYDAMLVDEPEDYHKYTGSKGKIYVVLFADTHVSYLLVLVLVTGI